MGEGGGATPFKMLDPAGDGFEWTADPSDGRSDRYLVEGAGSWDDRGCGVCRRAARRSRRADLRHIPIGFRLVREAE